MSQYTKPVTEDDPCALTCKNCGLDYWTSAEQANDCPRCGCYQWEPHGPEGHPDGNAACEGRSASDVEDNPQGLGLEEDLDAISTDAAFAIECLERGETATARRLLRGIKSYADRWTDEE